MTATPGSRPNAVRIAKEALSPQRKRFLPVPLRLVAALATLIGIGTGLLRLPPMTTQRISFIDALFTATSASAVTGLTVLTTSTAFTRLGQWVILFLMELGGLGFLVVTVLTLRLLGRRISLIDRLAVSNSLGLASPRAIVQILGRTVAFMLAVEGIGTLILWAHWHLSGIAPAGDAAFYALFHSVAAFCNAGFDLFSGAPGPARGVLSDPLSLLTLGGLVIVGGLGIPVYMELLNWRVVRTAVRSWKGAGAARRRRLSLQTRLALWSAAALILAGWVGLLISEFRHPGVLADLTVGERVLQTWFQSVAARTAGFAGFADFTSINQASRLLLMGLMFIGSAPASMGGGITTGTFSVLMVAMWSFARGDDTVHAGQRTISMAAIWRAVAVLVISLMVVLSATWLLLLSQDAEFSPALFEVISAFSTTGLSLGLTGQLNTVGRLLIIAVMFWGRLGAITIMIALLKRGTHERLKQYPEETVLVG
jgi:trk system potassium uptake protein TrkH